MRDANAAGIANGSERCIIGVEDGGCPPLGAAPALGSEPLPRGISACRRLFHLTIKSKKNRMTATPATLPTTDPTTTEVGVGLEFDEFSDVPAAAVLVGLLSPVAPDTPPTVPVAPATKNEDDCVEDDEARDVEDDSVVERKEDVEVKVELIIKDGERVVEEWLDVAVSARRVPLDIEAS